MSTEHFPHYPELTGPVVVCRDGKPISGAMDAGQAFGWLLSHQGQSVDYALTYGGYSVHPAPKGTPSHVFTGPVYRRAGSFWYRATNPISGESRPRGPFASIADASDDRMALNASDGAE